MTAPPELIDQDVEKRADIAAVLCILRSVQDHVLEVYPAIEAAVPNP